MCKCNGWNDSFQSSEIKWQTIKNFDLEIQGEVFIINCSGKSNLRKIESTQIIYFSSFENSDLEIVRIDTNIKSVSCVRSYTVTHMYLAFVLKFDLWSYVINFDFFKNNWPAKCYNRHPDQMVSVHVYSQRWTGSYNVGIFVWPWFSRSIVKVRWVIFRFLKSLTSEMLETIGTAIKHMYHIYNQRHVKQRGTWPWILCSRDKD